MITKRSFLFSASAGAFAVGTPALWQQASSQVARGAVRLLVGFPPGGPVDVVGRLLVNEMKDYAPTIIVENRPGGGGRVALEQLRTSAADGSVFLLTPASMVTIYPHVYKNLSYVPLRDFAPVTTVCTFPSVLAVGPKVAASVQTVADFVAWCRANPQQASFGSPSAGAEPHFTGVMLARAAGIELQHIPYQGAAPAMQDLLAGEIASNITVLPAVIPQLSSGKIRALATTGPRRSPLLPNVPTLVESGFPDLVSVAWFGIYLPVRTPSEVINRLNMAVRGALKTPAVIDGLTNLSFEVAGDSPAAMADIIKRDTERWGPIVEASGFRPDD